MHCAGCGTSFESGSCHAKFLLAARPEASPYPFFARPTLCLRCCLESAGGGMAGLAKPGRAKAWVAACELARNGPHAPLPAPRNAGSAIPGDSCRFVRFVVAPLLPTGGAANILGMLAVPE